MIPLGVFQVTFSLQFFFALLAGFLLGGRLGFLSVLAYLLAVIIGAAAAYFFFTWYTGIRFF